MPFLAKVAAQALTAAEQAAADEQAAQAKAAADAAAAAAAALVPTARDRLTAVLGHDADADVLTVLHCDPVAALVVLTDGQVDLAVTAGGTVAVVTPGEAPGEWTRLGDVAELADVARILAAQPPPR